MKPARVLVVGLENSFGSRPMANSVRELLVAFIFANSYEPSSLKSSNPPAIITFALPERSVSQAISSDCRAVALTGDKKSAIMIQCYPYQAPTGILMGPLDDIRSRFTHPATVLMYLDEGSVIERTLLNTRMSLRLLEDIHLYVLLFAAILKHCSNTLGSSHATTQTRTDFRWVDILIELVGIRNAGHCKGLCSAHQCPKGSTVNLRNNVVGKSIAASRPSSRNLPCYESVEAEGLGDDDASPLLKLGEPLPRRLNPNVTFIVVLQLEFAGLDFGNFQWLQIMVKLDFLRSPYVSIAGIESVN